jgi:DNA-binding CsgD family transcriptional regulator
LLKGTLMMLGNLAFDLEIRDGTDRLDPRVWRAVMATMLSRTGEGLVLCDAELDVLFATPRAIHLLARVGMEPGGELPENVSSTVRAQVEHNDPTRLDRLVCIRGGSALNLQTGIVRGAPPARVAIWVREEILRDDRLYAAMKERFSLTPRRFKLAQLVRKGLTNRQIAEQLELTESTVKVYLHELYRDCGVGSRTALVALLDRWSA